MYRLRVVPPSGEAFERPLAGESLVIGRSPEVDVSIPDRFLSRRHARLYLRGETLFVEDLGSRNGTRLNGRPLAEPRPVGVGDVIQLCGSTLTIHTAPEDAGAAEERSDFTVLRSAAALLRAPSPEELSSQTEDALRRYTDRLRILNEVHQALGQSLGLDPLLDLILERVFEHLRPEAGAIFLRGSDGGFHLARRRPLDGAGEAPGLSSQTLLREVAGKGMAALVLDAQSDLRFAEAHSILASGVRSLVAAPLLAEGDSFGMIALSSRAHVRQFSEEDLEILTSLASAAGLRIRNVRLAEEAAERRRLQAELDLARRIQLALLQETLPSVPGYAIHALNVPSRGVSGDFYEVASRRAGEELALMVADVSGKGMGASLLAASLEALTTEPIETGVPLEQLFRRVSRRLHQRTPPEKYATAFLAVLEPAAGILRYANAGHPPAFLLRAGGDTLDLGATGPPLGLLPEAAYGIGETRLDKGDTLAVFSDGLVEAENPEGEEFGLARLRETCSSLRAAPPEELARRLDEVLQTFVAGEPFADDRTLVLLRRLSG